MRLLKRVVAAFERADSPRSLGWFRIAMALFCLLKLWSVRDSLMEVYGQYGFIQWAITRGTLPEPLPHLGNVALFLGKFGLSANEAVYAILWTYVAALVQLLLGVWTRFAAATAWCLHLLLMYGSAGLLYGMDYFTHIGLFYCIIMPAGAAVSLPALLQRRAITPSVEAGVTRRMLQIQMCIVYASAGLEKAKGIQWWNGDAVWRSLTLPVFGQLDFSWLASVPWLAMLLGWSVLLIEVGYAFMMWWPRTRVPWLLATCGFHLGIGLFMGMWLFAFIMVILNLGAFGHDAVKDIRTKFASRNTVDTRTPRPVQST